MKVKRTGLANGLDVDVWERQARAAHWLGGEAIGEIKVQMVVNSPCTEHMVCARHRLSAMSKAAPFSSLMTSEAPQGTWPARPTQLRAQSTRIQTQVFWALMLPTRKTLLSVLSSQKPPSSCQTLLPPSDSNLKCCL